MRCACATMRLVKACCVAAALVLSLHVVQGKVFKTRCQLTRELMRNGFSKTFLSNWVCLVEQESGKDTAAYTEKSTRRKYYGLFQIPSEWCREGRKGGKCDITCESLRDDDIRDDSACAQKIFEAEGFKYWSKWESRCKGQILPDIEKCPDFASPPPAVSRPSPPRERRRTRRSAHVRRVRRRLRSAQRPLLLFRYD